MDSKKQLAIAESFKRHIRAMAKPVAWTLEQLQLKRKINGLASKEQKKTDERPALAR